MKRGQTKLGTSRPVLIHLPLDMLRQLDAAADAFGMYRAEVIRRSLKRELSTILGEEVQRMQRMIRSKLSKAKASTEGPRSSRGRWRWFRSWLSHKD